MLLLSLVLSQATLVAAVEASIRSAVAAGDLEAVVLALPADAAAVGRHSVCALDDSATRFVCSRYTLARTGDRTATVTHTDPAEYDGTPVADIVAAEQAWVGP